jgi:Ubiquitin family.
MKRTIIFVAFCTVFCAFIASPTSAQVTTIPIIDEQPNYGGEPQPHPQTIYVKTRINGTVVLVPELVFFTDLVLWVKMDIADLLGIPLDSFELVFGNTILDEELPLNAYGITSKSVLSVRYN